MKYNKFLEDLELIDSDHKNFSIDTPLREDAFKLSDTEKISVIEKATHYKIYSEKELFEHYKKFQFNINQLLDVEESLNSLNPIQSRALIYQRTLLTKEPKLKLQFARLLKELFYKDEIDLAFDLELTNILSEIKIENVSTDFMTFYENFSKKKR